MTEMKEPTVSVIITTHNRDSLVGRAIDSVLAQTFEDFELIVVDDASADNTTEVLRYYTDLRVKNLRNSKRLGGPTSRNRGISEAKGQFIAFLDDDDEWYNSKLERQLAKIDGAPTNVALVYSGFIICNENGSITEQKAPLHKGDVYKRVLERNFVGGCSVPLIKADCLARAGGFDPGLKSCQDWDLWIRLARIFHFEFVPDVLVRYRHHRNQISSDYSKLIPGRTAVIGKHLPSFQKYPEILVIHLKRMGKLHAINGTYRESLRWFGRALSTRPADFLKIVAWLAFEFPKTRFVSRHGKFHRYHPKKEK